MPNGDRSSSSLLKDKYVAVACSPEKSTKLLNGFRDMGAEVILLPVIAIQEAEDKSKLDAALSNLSHYSWIIFTSSYAAIFFAERMRTLGMAADQSKHNDICALGPGTAATLRERGIKVSLVAEEHVGEGVLEALASQHGDLRQLAGKRILIPRAKGARDILPRELSAAGATVEIVTCYETVQGNVAPELLRSISRRAPDLLVFTSSSTVRNFVEILGREAASTLLGKAVVAALGPITGKTAESFGKKPEIIPSESTIPALLNAVRDFFC